MSLRLALAAPRHLFFAIIRHARETHIFMHLHTLTFYIQVECNRVDKRAAALGGGCLCFSDIEISYPALQHSGEAKKPAEKESQIMGIPYDENDGGPPLGPLKKITAGKWSECVYVYICVCMCPLLGNRLVPPCTCDIILLCRYIGL
jgi:hypothetical protein